MNFALTRIAASISNLPSVNQRIQTALERTIPAFRTIRAGRSTATLSGDTYCCLLTPAPFVRSVSGSTIEHFSSHQGIGYDPH